MLKKMSAVAMVGCSVFLAAAAAPGTALAWGPEGQNGFEPGVFSSNAFWAYQLGNTDLDHLDDANVSQVWLNGSYHLDGAQFLKELVRCALPSSHTVYAGNIALQGEFGVAPRWGKPDNLNRELDQRWVSACMGVLLNGVGRHVPIAISGNQSALSVPDSADSSLFTVDEISMFGNFFTGGETPAGAIYVCTEANVEFACGPNTSQWLASRICGQGATSASECGVTYLGSCNDFCTGEPGARSCQTTALTGPNSAYGTPFTEVISVKLKRTDASVLYSASTTCDFKRVDGKLDTRCADGSVEDQFTSTMVGCGGAVYGWDTASLCGAGWTTCSPSQWTLHRPVGQAPSHDYRTSASTTGEFDPLAMVCPPEGALDAFGNWCQGDPDEYLAEESSSWQTAGALCCALSPCSTDAQCGAGAVCDNATDRCMPGCHANSNTCPAGYLCELPSVEALLTNGVGTCTFVPCGRLGEPVCTTGNACEFPTVAETDGLCHACNDNGPCENAVYREYNGWVHLFTLNAWEGPPWGYHQEGSGPAFYLQRRQAAGTMAYNRCYLGNGARIDTTYDCSVYGGWSEGVLGYIGTFDEGTWTCPQPGATPLYSLYASASHDYFYTTSNSERQSATNGGYWNLGVAGCVWTSPN